MCKLHCTLCGAVPVTNWYSGALAVFIVLALVSRLFRPGASFIDASDVDINVLKHQALGFLVLIRAVEVSRAVGGRKAML